MLRSVRAAYCFGAELSRLGISEVLAAPCRHAEITMPIARNARRNIVMLKLPFLAVSINVRRAAYHRAQIRYSHWHCTELLFVRFKIAAPAQRIAPAQDA